MPIIDEFRGAHRFLSNFYPAPVILDGEVYPTVEHAYQAAKTEDLYFREQIRATALPGDAKKLGQIVPLRKDWDRKKRRVMYKLVKQKFRDHPELGEMLLATGSAKLIEGNYWGDTYWGMCRGEGHNHLGKILMMVRKELRQSRDRAL